MHTKPRQNEDRFVSNSSNVQRTANALGEPRPAPQCGPNIRSISQLVVGIQALPVSPPDTLTGEVDGEG